MSSADTLGDDLFFAPEEDEVNKSRNTWKILIVDDDPDVHSVTTMILSKVVFEGRGLSFFHAYSGKEGCQVMAEHTDIAVAFVDVTMETDDAGLQAVRYIREVLHNSTVRLILRTGQPGIAPEESVIVDYDINDYKSKTELTSQKLFTTLVSALRSYRDLQTIEAARLGLRQVITSSAGLFDFGSIHQFISGVLIQLSSLLGMNQNGILATRQGSIDNHDSEEVYLVAAVGSYGEGLGKPARTVLPQTILDRIEAAFRTAESVFAEDHCVVFIPVPKSRPVVGYVSYDHTPLDKVDTDLLQVFCLNVGIAFDNFRLFDKLGQTQQATVLALGKLAEFNDDHTGDHLARVELLSSAVANKLADKGLFPDIIDRWFLDNIGLACALHDVGKIGLPRELLCKPGKLTPEEFEVMKRHAGFGYSVLHEAAGKIEGVTYLSLAAEVALTHHEKFDGSGYPNQLVGNAIPLSGRIVAVVDVYDALCSSRPYKEGWEKELVIDYLRKNSGSHFDPQVVAALLEVVLDENYSTEGLSRQLNRWRV